MCTGTRFRMPRGQHLCQPHTRGIVAESSVVPQPVSVLSGAPCSPAYIPRAVERLVTVCRHRRYPRKAAVIRPGDPATTLYYVIEGSASICSQDQDGCELVLAYVHAGQFVGEASLFALQPRHDTLVRTRTPCRLAEITCERLFTLFNSTLREEYPWLLFAIGTQLAERVKRASHQASRLAFMSVADRVCHTLSELCREPDAVTRPEGTQIRVSRQEISRIAGCSREMVGRVLKNLALEGTIAVRGKTIVVHGLPGTA